MAISFDVYKEDQVLIDRVVDRFIAQYDPGVMEDYRTDIMMSITACHANGCPLDLEKLSISPCPVLCHDVWGIHQHLNHETGGLVGNFWPKTATRTRL